MAVLKTIQIGEPVLRETTKSIEKYDDSYVQKVVTDLVDTMREVNLVGMAAPQIGEPVRIFVVEVRETKYRNKATQPLEVFINPVITTTSSEIQLGYEGCGSVAHGGLFGEVERSKEITVKYINRAGEQCMQTFSDFMAVIIQHEMDHLNSIEFTDISNPKSFVSSEYYLEHIRGK